MALTGKQDLETARQLMEAFARRTGLRGSEGDSRQRYLWTDAFAVQTFFGLAHATGDASYRQLAIRLIAAVHEVLGKYSSNDSREGWLSGLPDEEGRRHPTAGGLRIGKRLPEREATEPIDEYLEWERDGQYFHYLTRWVNALLQAKQETGEQTYADWAAELVLAGAKFIYKSGGSLRMYWKMSIDLSRPLVSSMGAHDPLEGLICTLSVRQEAPQQATALEPVLNDFDRLCAGHDWATTDALGIGGLLLNALRTTTLNVPPKQLPQAVKPEKLFADSLAGLRHFAGMHRHSPASQRLPFRECGLSLSVRAAAGMQERFTRRGLQANALEKYIPLAKALEDFWSTPENQQASTWLEHHDINAVTLAASLVAQYYPQAFC